MLPSGKLHCSQQQRTGPGSPGCLWWGTSEQQSSGSVPRLTRNAGCQHPDPVLLHQQGLGVFQLQHVWSHILCDVHIHCDFRLRSSLQRVDCTNFDRRPCHALWFDDSVRRGAFTAPFPGGFDYLEEEGGAGKDRLIDCYFIFTWLLCHIAFFTNSVSASFDDQYYSGFITNIV